jgi:hypothetical protein
MKPKVILAVSGCAAAILTQTASPRMSAAPVSPVIRPRLITAGTSNRPSVFTLRYVAFVAQPQTTKVAAQYKSFPPVLAHNLSANTRYAMVTTPEDFTRVLQTDQPDHDFKIALAGSAILYNSNIIQSHIADGPNPSDPYGLTLVDTITVIQNSDTTLDFVSQGNFAYRALKPSGDFGSKSGWNGENKELAIGRTYLWGATKKPDGTCVTWAFCILPGSVDQVASTWKRHNGALARVLASGEAVERIPRQ